MSNSIHSSNTPETKPQWRLEYSMLRPDATIDDLNRTVRAAVDDGAVAIRTAGVYTGMLKRMLSGARGISIVAAVAYPHGGSKSTIKAIEATAAIKDGADEVDVVPHLPNYLGGNFDGARDELLEIVRAARACRRDVKINVVLAGALFGDSTDGRLIEAACRAVREGACDGIVLPEDSSGSLVSRVKPHAHELTIKVVTSDIDPSRHLRAWLDAGADRISIDLPSPASL